jgi:hypothetical protein
MPSRAVENTRTFQKASLVVVMIQGGPTPPRKLFRSCPSGRQEFGRARSEATQSESATPEICCSKNES